MYSNTSSTLNLDIAQLIHSQKGVLVSRLLTQSFEHIGFDLIDLIDIILAVEKQYGIIIPDEVPLNSVNDFVSFMQSEIALNSVGTPV